MGVNSLPKTVVRQRRDCDLNPGISAPEASTVTTRLPSRPERSTAVSNWPHRYETHVPYRITQCSLPPDRGDVPALTPAEAGTRTSFK